VTRFKDLEEPRHRSYPEPKIGQSILVYPEVGNHGKEMEPWGGIVVSQGVTVDDETGEYTKTYRTLDYRRWPSRRTDWVREDQIDPAEVSDSPEERLTTAIRELGGWLRYLPPPSNRKQRTGRLDHQEELYAQWIGRLLTVLRTEPF